MHNRALLTLILLASSILHAAEPDRTDDLILLDAASVANLQLDFATAEETPFAETLFCLGQLVVLPGKKAIVSSRISGRAHSVLVVPHQTVEIDQELIWIESRQPGDPPPTIPLSAPISGLISKVSLAPGQPVSPDDALIEILDLDTIEAAAQVPLHLAGQIALGQTATVRVIGYPDQPIVAKLAHIAAQADPTTSTIEAAFHLPNPDKRLRPGMKAEFHITTQQRQNVMAIPRAAVQGDAANRFVFVKDYELENAFVKCPVVLGAQNDQFVEIKQGLLPGDEVVINGAYALSFAGQGSLSLKQALDAAHGHPHAEDGSELSTEHDSQHSSDAAHDHDHPTPSHWNLLTIFFAATSLMFLLLLIITLYLFRKPATA